MKKSIFNITILYAAFVIAFLSSTHVLANDFCSQLRVTVSPVDNYSKATNLQDIEFQTVTNRKSNNREKKAYIKVELQHDTKLGSMENRGKTTYILYGVPWGSFSYACVNHFDILGKIDRVRVTNAQCIDESSALQQGNIGDPFCYFDR